MVLVSSLHFIPKGLTDFEIAIMGVSLGRSRATGRLGNVKMPSLVIWFVSKCFYSLSESKNWSLTMLQRVVHLEFRTCLAWFLEVLLRLQ